MHGPSYILLNNNISTWLFQVFIKYLERDNYFKYLPLILKKKKLNSTVQNKMIGRDKKKTITPLHKISILIFITLIINFPWQVALWIVVDCHNKNGKDVPQRSYCLNVFRTHTKRIFDPRKTVRPTTKSIGRGHETQMLLLHKHSEMPEHLINCFLFSYERLSKSIFQTQQTYYPDRNNNDHDPSDLIYWFVNEKLK